jgi:competence protein ComEC
MTLETVTALIGTLIHEPQAGLLSGILFGVKANISKELHDALITTGTLHIIALSGMNISILVSLVNLFLLRFLRRPIANVATSIIIIGFISFVGISPSVLRAAIMAGISLLGVAFGRQTWPLLAWILAVVTMIVLNPLWIGDLSFQLSIMATLGILLFSRKQQNPEEQSVTRAAPHSFVHNVWAFFEDDLRVTLAAQVFTIPIILFQFHRISLVSPLSNILIGWLMGPIMILGFLLVAVGMIWAPLASVVAWIVWVPLTVVIEVILWTAKIPFASISW